MDSKEILETLKAMRWKCNGSKKPSWYETASEEDKSYYDQACKEQYEALNFAINLVKSYRALETANEQIVNTLSELSAYTDNEE